MRRPNGPLSGLPVLLLVSACDPTASEPDPSRVGGKADGVQPSASSARWVDWHVNDSVAEVQYAGHNAGHHVGTFDPGSFDPQVAWQEMRQVDVDRGCGDGRRYSTSRASAVELYRSFVEDEDPYQHAAEEDPFASSEAHAGRIAEIVDDDSNVGVFASRYDVATGTDPERCLYHTFWIYRADGTAVRLQFDYTD